MRVLPFTALGYRFEDARSVSRDEQHRALGLLLDGLTRVSPEIRCAGNPLEGTLTRTARTQRTELTEEECTGDIIPITFAAFDPAQREREVVGAFNLYGIRIVSDTRHELIVRARPLPAFNDLDGMEYARFALDAMEFFVNADLDLDDGRRLSFAAIEFSTFYKPSADPERTDVDVRVELVDREFDLRKARDTDPLRGDKTLDTIGRQLTTIRRAR